MIVQGTHLDPAALIAGTGWELKPEGACLGHRCVPMPERADDGSVEIGYLARRLGMELVRDEQAGLAALGPESGARALTSARMPELELPDRNGRPFSLRSLWGTRVVMIAWASW